MVQRPPTEPPDLKSPVKELFTMRTLAGQNVIDKAEKENGATRGAEDSTVAKEKVVDVGSADLTRGSSAMVGAFAEGMWTAAGRTTAATVTDRGLWDRQLRRFVLLTPPPLLAAIFPWDREEATQTERAASEWLFEETYQKRLVPTTDGDYADFRKGLGGESSVINMERANFTRAKPEGERNLAAEQVMVTTEGGKRQRKRMGLALYNRF